MRYRKQLTNLQQDKPWSSHWYPCLVTPMPKFMSLQSEVKGCTDGSVAESTEGSSENHSSIPSTTWRLTPVYSSI